MLFSCSHVTGIKKAGRKQEFSLEDITFSLEAGYLMVLAGENGAGKTTLFHSILDRKKCYTGEIRLNGRDIHENHEETLHEIGFVSDENLFFKKYTALENADMLSVFYKNWDGELFSHAMKAMGMSLHKVTGNMSRGEFMKFQMAFAMAYKPKLYLLDEATAGMDPVFRKDFYKILRGILTEEKASIIMTSHIQEEIEFQADYTAIMNHGRLIQFGENPA